MGPEPGRAERPRIVVVGSLGIGQILVWGASYYLLAVLAEPISRATGWSLGWVVGALSVGLLVSGLGSPAVGRLIERLGGRPVLTASAVLLAVGLVIAGIAPSLPVFYAGWVVIGLAMAAGLYDPAFSTLGRLYGEQARSAITHLTLFGGFSSTICWPLSALLAERVGWRGACFGYAAISLVIVLPLYLFGLPREPAAAVAHSHPDAPVAPVRGNQSAAFLILAAGLTLASFIMTLIAVELLVLLQARGLTLSSSGWARWSARARSAPGFWSPSWRAAAIRYGPWSRRPFSSPLARPRCWAALGRWRPGWCSTAPEAGSARSRRARFRSRCSGAPATRW